MLSFPPCECTKLSGFSQNAWRRRTKITYKIAEQFERHSVIERDSSKMERYGYVILSDSDSIDVHRALFADLASCLRCGINYCQSEKKNIAYFKILSNSGIVKQLHSDKNNNEYGFIYLHQMCGRDSYSISNLYSMRLQESLLNCILEAKDYEIDIPDTPHYKFKIGYFKIMNDDELLVELHSKP